MPSTYSSVPNDVPLLPIYAVVVTPSDTTLYDADSGYSGGITIYVLTTGDLTVTPAGGGDDIDITGIPANVLLPFRVKAVKAATTAVVLGIS